MVILGVCVFRLFSTPWKFLRRNPLLVPLVQPSVKVKKCFLCFRKEDRIVEFSLQRSVRQQTTMDKSGTLLNYLNSVDISKQFVQTKNDRDNEDES